MSRPTLVKADAPPAPKPCPFTPEQVAWLMELLDRRDEVERGLQRKRWDLERQSLLGIVAAGDALYYPERKKNPRT
jgi:hypothetical protein